MQYVNILTMSSIHTRIVGNAEFQILLEKLKREFHIIHILRGIYQDHPILIFFFHQLNGMGKYFIN